MKISKAARLILMAMIGLSSSGAMAAKLSVGDPAPKLQTGKWIQGEAVKEFDKDKVYLVEFWATWCGPCRVSIPHLNELHTKFKDKGLIVIGQNVWERDESQVEPFIKKMGDKMTYRVAMDDKQTDKEGAMASTWMKAADQNGIPAAFLVNKEGKIAWIGHPMSLKESTIEEVISGKYDIEKASAEAKEATKKQAELQKHSMEFSSAMRAKDWTKAEADLKAIEGLLPADERDGVDMARLQVFLGKKDLPAAYTLVEKISDANKDEPMLNNHLAWELATREDIKEPNVKLLEKLAARANEASGGKNPAILDTVARVKFMGGNKDEAIKVQEKAIELADDADMESNFKKTLASYKEGKLPSAK